MLNMEILNDLYKLNETETPAGGGTSLIYHWIIHSIDSFKHLIHSRMKQVTVYECVIMNH